MSEEKAAKADASTDAQRFEDAMHTILAAPKERVDARIAAEREERKKRKAEQEK